VYAAREPAGGDGWRAVHPAAYDGALRVTVGGADGRWSDHINVGGEEADVLAGPHALPFPPASIAELVIRGLPAATTRHEFERSMVPHWADLLAPHGVLRIHVRDPRAWLERIAEPEDGDDGESATLAVDSWPGAILPAYVIRTLEDQGFTRVRVEAERWVEGRPEAEIVAERRGAWRTSA
jgi:hypothetical protein